MKKTLLKFGLFSMILGASLTGCSSSDDDESGTSGTTIDVEGTVESTFTQKVLIEDFTGAWCGWCPRVAWALEQVEEVSEDVVGVAIHYGDDYHYSGPFSNSIQSIANSYPTAYINRTELWDTPENDNLSQPLNLLDGEAEQGLAISSELDGDDLEINVYAGFHSALSGTAKIVVYILEDGLLEDQAEYNSPAMYEDLPQSGGYYTDFVMNGVLRYVPSNGSTVPAADNVAGNIYGISYDIDLNDVPYEDTANMSIAAFIIDGDGNTINVQKAALNETVDFDYE